MRTQPCNGIRVLLVLSAGFLLLGTISCGKSPSPGGWDHQRRLALTRDELQFFADRPFWAEPKRKALLSRAIGLTETDAIPREPYLIVGLLPHNRADVEHTFLELVWLKHESDPEVSTVAQLSIVLKGDPPGTHHNVPLPDGSQLMPRGYLWMRPVDLDLVDGRGVGFHYQNQQSAPGEKTVVISLGRDTLQGAILLWITDAGGRASNVVEMDVLDRVEQQEGTQEREKGQP